LVCSFLFFLWETWFVHFGVFPVRKSLGFSLFSLFFHNRTTQSAKQASKQAHLPAASLRGIGFISVLDDWQHLFERN